MRTHLDVPPNHFTEETTETKLEMKVVITPTRSNYSFYSKI